ncbi:MAG: hypothetical protein HYR63_25830 [Proteobacteria bacterium]|nr:hypothetical protein [Pseudomonadota bacterium]MBI3497350.1 hypothetical protein [Pseudomonadota bacterium]
MAGLSVLSGRSPARADSGTPIPGRSAMDVLIDPATGQIMPTPPGAPGSVPVEHLKQLLLNATTEGLPVERRADGTEIMNLQGRFQHAAVIQMNGDGTVTVTCDLHGEHRLSLAAVNSLRAWALPSQQ